MDNIRDYATAAFRHYAKCGRKSAEQVRAEIYSKAQEFAVSPMTEPSKTKSPGKPVEAAILAGEAAVEDRKAELWDIIAVDDTLKQLKPEVIQVVEMVYFQDADKPLQRGDISMRVTEAASVLPAGEATIYRWLAKARIAFARERCLRINAKR